MEVRSGAISFQHAKGSGPRRAQTTFIFPRAIDRAVAGLSGFSAGFHREDGDHHLGILQMELETRIQNNVAVVEATYGLRDWSGDWDDEYEGVVDIVLLAELADPAAVPPRGDLSITGVEVNQAIQSFRSHLELDAANVMPDNSIPLVARKATGLRVYVDYDDSAGLPAITDLSGEVEIITAFGGTTVTLTPEATITPLRDNQIDRGNTAHTVNFIIAEAWCQGNVTIRARVFDAADPSSGSAVFQRELNFREVAPARVTAVQIRYTGQGMDATPTQAQIMTSLGFTEVTYPVPEVFVTNFLNLTFNEDFSPAGSGCGSAFSNLLDDLDDLVGDSDDLVYGFLPTGITYGPAVGCGRSGLGAGPTDRPTTVAHEFGHALGRRHAPAGCNNPDNDFPQYGAFAAGSIGEFGYDTRDNSVYDPASQFDFMCGRPRWVSPYTYNALASQFPPVEFSTFASAFSMLRAAFVEPTEVALPAPRRSSLQPRLFLGLEIDRDRKVTPRHSFHYDAPKRKYDGVRTPFTAELTDDKGNTLACSRLFGTCVQCDDECWPKTIRTPVVFTEGARHLRVFEGRDELAHYEIPAAPELRLEAGYDQKHREWVVAWQAAQSEGQSLRYLVQWRDASGTWRGAAPRIDETRIRLPVRLIGDRDQIAVRVLATSGIATGMAQIELERPAKVPPPSVELIDVSTSPGERTIDVRAVRSDGMTIPDADLVWFDAQGREIGRGRSLSLRALGEGEHQVRAVLRDTGFGVGERTWLISVGTDGRSLAPTRCMDSEAGRSWPPVYLKRGE